MIRGFLGQNTRFRKGLVRREHIPEVSRMKKHLLALLRDAQRRAAIGGLASEALRRHQCSTLYRDLTGQSLPIFEAG
jgi:hypothetical protein